MKINQIKSKVAAKVAKGRAKVAKKCGRAGKRTVAAGCILAILAFAGCRSFYENAGAHVRTGSITAPIEISEPTSSVNIRALYAMDGIDFYAAKNCKVRMHYENAYTNGYFGIVTTRGVQRSEVEIDPTVEESEAAPDEPSPGADK